MIESGKQDTLHHPARIRERYQVRQDRHHIRHSGRIGPRRGPGHPGIHAGIHPAALHRGDSAAGFRDSAADAGAQPAAQRGKRPVARHVRQRICDGEHQQRLPGCAGTRTCRRDGTVSSTTQTMKNTLGEIFDPNVLVWEYENNITTPWAFYAAMTASDAQQPTLNQIAVYDGMQGTADRMALDAAQMYCFLQGALRAAISAARTDAVSAKIIDAAGAQAGRSLPARRAYPRRPSQFNADRALRLRQAWPGFPDTEHTGADSVPGGVHGHGPGHSWGAAGRFPDKGLPDADLEHDHNRRHPPVLYDLRDLPLEPRSSSRRCSYSG